MSELKNIKFTKTHEWIKIEGDHGILGISDHAQSNLGDVVYFDPIALHKEVAAGDVIASIESIKAVSDIYAPFDCLIQDVNPALADQPSLVNSSPYDKGWLLKFKILASEDPHNKGTMTKNEYDNFLNEAS